MKGEFWYLESVYGKQTDEIMLALLACIVVSIFLYGTTICSHILLVCMHVEILKTLKFIPFAVVCLP